MTILTNENFNKEVLQEKTMPVLIDFYANWCGPCRMQLPILDEFDEQFGNQVKVAKCNVDNCEDLAIKYGVETIPAFVVLNNGEVVNTASGLHDVNKLKTLTGI